MACARLDMVRALQLAGDEALHTAGFEVKNTFIDEIPPSPHVLLRRFVTSPAPQLCLGVAGDNNVPDVFGNSHSVLDRQRAVAWVQTGQSVCEGDGSMQATETEECAAAVADTVAGHTAAVVLPETQSACEVVEAAHSIDEVAAQPEGHIPQDSDAAQKAEDRDEVSTEHGSEAPEHRSACQVAEAARRSREEETAEPAALGLNTPYAHAINEEHVEPEEHRPLTFCERCCGRMRRSLRTPLLRSGC